MEEMGVERERQVEQELKEELHDEDKELQR